MSKTIGYLHCTQCDKYTYIQNPKDLKIYFHPDDNMSLMSATCRCGAVTTTRVSWVHARNFSRKGVSTLQLNEYFSELTEEEISGWDVEGEVNALFK